MMNEAPNCLMNVGMNGGEWQHAIEVRLHKHKADVVILTLKTVSTH